MAGFSLCVSSPLSEIRNAWRDYLKHPLRWQTRSVNHSLHCPQLGSLHRPQGGQERQPTKLPGPCRTRLWGWLSPRGSTELLKAPRTVEHSDLSKMRAQPRVGWERKCTAWGPSTGWGRHCHQKTQPLTHPTSKNTWRVKEASTEIVPSPSVLQVESRDLVFWFVLLRYTSYA